MRAGREGEPYEINASRLATVFQPGRATTAAAAEEARASSSPSLSRSIAFVIFGIAIEV